MAADKDEIFSPLDQSGEKSVFASRFFDFSQQRVKKCTARCGTNLFVLV
jgi:hypothetical protein